MDLTRDQIEREHDLVIRAQKDPSGFSRLYDKYFEPIFNFIYRRTDDENLTADLTSQTFLKALQNLNKYEFRGVPFSAWLYRIASNEVNKFYRRTSKRITFSLEEERFKEIIEENNADYDEDDIKRLISLLRDLPTDQLLALELRFFESRNFKEIAYILGISESGAKMRVYRILERLRQQLKNRKEVRNDKA